MHLRAAMPAAPTAVRGQMDVRIARKVAALTGLADPVANSDDAGGGRSWFADYRALTTTELSLGAAISSGKQEELGAGVVDAGLFRRSGSTFSSTTGGSQSPLPSVTLQEYGPDTKAALVLTGANLVLRPVSDALIEVLVDLRRRIDDECLLLAVTQALLQEVFEAQPHLLMQGVQAAMIQRALRLSDAVQSRTVAVSGPVPVARSEHGWPLTETVRHQPDQLALLWSIWDAVVSQREAPLEEETSKEGAAIAFQRLDGYEQNHGFLITGGQNAREEWVAVLREVSESHLLGTSPGLPLSTIRVFRRETDAHAVAVFARERQIELMLAALAPRLVPLTGGHGPKDVSLPSFDAPRWTDADRLTRRTALLAQYYCVRAAGWLAGMKDLNRRRDRPTCARRFADLVRAAGELLEPDDPLRAQLGAQGRAYVLQYDACRGQLDHEACRRIVEDLDRLVAFANEGRYSEAQLVEHLQIVLVELETYRSAIAWFEKEQTGRRVEVTADMRRLWSTARLVRDRLLADVDDADLSYLDHDYAGFLISDREEGQDVMEGIRILDEQVIPARVAIAQKEGRSRGLRLSRQVLIRGLRTGLEAGLGTETLRAAWAKQAYAVATVLRTDPETDALVTQRDTARKDFDNSVLILLLRIAEGYVAALASGLLPEPSCAQIEEADRALRRVESYAETSRRHATTPDGPVDPVRLLQIREIRTRWQSWRSNNPGRLTQGPASLAGTPTSPPRATP